MNLFSLLRHRTTDWMVVPALAIWVILIRLPTFDSGISDPDESLFLLIGGDWAAGHAPYEAIWDVKPPGLLAIFAAIRRFFSPGILEMRILLAVAVFATSLALWRFARHHLGPQAMAILAGCLYAPYAMVSRGIGSPPELLLAPFAVFGMDMAVTEFKAARPGMPFRAAAVGLVFGCGYTIKQTAAFEALPAGMLIALAQVPGLPRRVRWLAFGAFVTAAGVPSLAYLAYAFGVGDPLASTLVPFVDAALRVNNEGFTLLEAIAFMVPRLAPLLPLVLGAVILIPERVAWWRGPDRAIVAIIALWLIAVASGVLAARTPLPRYYLPFEPPLILATILAIEILSRKAERLWRQRAVVVGLVVLIVSYPAIWLLRIERYDLFSAALPKMLVRTMQAAGLRPTDTIYVVDGDPLIYLLAEARIPTRYALPFHLVCPYRLPIDAGREIARIMAAGPRMVVISHRRANYTCEVETRLAMIDEDLDRSYVLLATGRGPGFTPDDAFDIYRRRDDSAP